MNQQTKFFPLGIQSGTLAREVKDPRVPQKYFTSFMFPSLQMQTSPDQLELLCHRFSLEETFDSRSPIHFKCILSRVASGSTPLPCYSNILMILQDCFIA
jgi:hypothetical protein